MPSDTDVRTSTGGRAAAPAAEPAPKPAPKPRLDDLKAAAQRAAGDKGRMDAATGRAPEGFKVKQGAGGWVYGVRGDGPAAEVMVLYDPRDPGRTAFRVRQEGPLGAIIKELFPGVAAPAGATDPMALDARVTQGEPVAHGKSAEQDATEQFAREDAQVRARFSDDAAARKSAVADAFKEMGEEPAGAGPASGSRSTGPVTLSPLQTPEGVPARRAALVTGAKDALGSAGPVTDQPKGETLPGWIKRAGLTRPESASDAVTRARQLATALTNGTPIGRALPDTITAEDLKDLGKLILSALAPGNDASNPSEGDESV